MNINDFSKVYEENKTLDKLFIDKYGNNDDIILKNQLELLVELGELANETKCFKYWSVKNANKDKVLEEYADVILMIFYFFRELDVSLSENFPNENNANLIDEFIILFELMAKFRYKYERELIKEIFINMLKLGELLELSSDEIINSCLNKIKIDRDRFKIDY